MTAAMLLIALLGSIAALADDPVELPCENLGPPLVVKPLSFEVVTQGPGEDFMAWARYETSERHAAVGVSIATGKTTWLDTTEYGRTHVFLARGADGALYIYTGNPGRFLRYDAESGELKDLGTPGSPASYWIGHCMDPQGNWYIGTYPATHVVRCDTRTGEVYTLGTFGDDNRQKYALSVAVSDDGIVYAPVGLHHRELWSCDPKTGEKRQILPAEMTAEQGSPTVWTGVDGRVYGKSGDTQFVCHPDRIEETTPGPRRYDATRLQAGTETVARLDEDGNLVLKDAQGQTRSVPTDYAGRPVTLFSVACEHGGKLWGGGLFPGLLWSLDPQTGAMTNHGMIAAGAIQIYDIISGPEGLWIATYMGCHLDLYDPAKPIEKDVNPMRIAQSVPGQERPNQWERGPDGKLYFGTTPAKGRLGGALVQVDPETRKWQQFPCPLTDLSITHLASIPETGEILACCSVGGGSSAIPSQTEGGIFLWGTAKAEMTWSGKPVPGTRTYWRAVRLRDGRVFGIADAKYYLFDPVKRELLATGDLPAKGFAFPTLNDGPVGPRGRVYGIGGGLVFAFDPETNAVVIVGQHPSLGKAHGFLVTEDETLYYGSGADLWRCELPK